MNRRQFLHAGIGGSVGMGVLAHAQDPVSADDLIQEAPELFPGIQHETFLNAAAGTPLGTFAEAGLRRFEGSWRQGHGASLGLVQEVVEEARVAFAGLIGAKPSEVALVPCTKAGEEIVLDGLMALRRGGNVVTNDLHFTGSLHNLVGLARNGMDVRIVRSRHWDVPLDDMRTALDERTALVAVTHVSNVNGRVEPLAELSELAHAHGALVYADIIQSAGVVPIDVNELGVDFAACSTYKWLFGTHGTGFLYVREDLQGAALADQLFPGYSRPNYEPWVPEADPLQDPFSFVPPADARRYQPGHVSYLGYCAAREGLALVEALGPERCLEHSVNLNARLLAELDLKRYPCISPHVSRSPIASFSVSNPDAVAKSLEDAGLRVSLGRSRLRVSPSIYNREEHMSALAQALNRA